MPQRSRESKNPDRERAVLVARACEAYVLGRLSTFARIANRLDAIGRVELARIVRTLTGN